MSLWLELGRVSAGLNLALVVGLGAVWFRNYRSHGASHTLALLAFAVFLFVENVLWIYFYVFDGSYVDWYLVTDTATQAGLSLLCVFETLALLFVARVTWQ